MFWLVDNLLFQLSKQFLHKTINLILAAHCIQNKFSHTKLSPGELVILLGRYNLDAKIELDSINARVKEIRLHPDWRAFDEKFDADIAMVILNSAVQFSNYIQPVCLPSSDDINKHQSGTIVKYLSRCLCERENYF